MSDGHHLYTSNDGSQILYDENTGKCCRLPADQNTPNYQNPHYYPVNTDYYHHATYNPVEDPSTTNKMHRKHNTTIQQLSIKGDLWGRYYVLERVFLSIFFAQYTEVIKKTLSVGKNGTPPIENFEF